MTPAKIKKLEQAIGPKPIWQAVGYKTNLIDWWERATEHETQRAERWKAEAIHAGYFPQRMIDHMDKGPE